MKKALILVVALLLLSTAAFAMDPVLGTVLGIGLNLLPGFGVGSFVQGDTVGGVVGLVGDAVGVGLIIVGYIEISSALLSATTGDLTGVTAAAEGAVGGYIWIVVGAIVYSGVEIFGIIRPIVFGAKQTKTGQAEGPTLVFDMPNGNAELALSFKL